MCEANTNPDPAQTVGQALSLNLNRFTAFFATAETTKLSLPRRHHVEALWGQAVAIRKQFASDVGGLANVCCCSMTNRLAT